MHELTINSWISGNGARWLTDDCPDSIRDAVLSGHNGSRWEIGAAIEALDAIRDDEIDPEDDETVYTWADSVTDIYNHSLRQWFAGDGWSYYEDYIDETGDAAGDVHRTIMAAQCMAYERIGAEVVEAFREWMEEQEEDGGE